MKPLVIFGAGDIARMAHYYFSTDSEHEVAAFTVDAAYRENDQFENLPIVDFEEVATRFPPAECDMFIALSYAKMNSIRAAKYHAAKKLGYRLASYVSSRCSFLTSHPVGDNCLVQEDNTIQPFVRIGNNVTLWSGNHVGHDSVIEDHCFITAQVVISGRVHVGAYSFVGVNATLRNSIRVAPRTLIGAGCVIMKDTIEGGVYLPERAKLFHKRSDQVDL